MGDAKSSQTEEVRGHQVEVQRKSSEATSNDCLLIFFGDRLSDKRLEAFLYLLALEKPRPDEVLLDGPVSYEGDNYPICS